MKRPAGASIKRPGLYSNFEVRGEETFIRRGVKNWKAFISKYKFLYSFYSI